MQHGHNVNNCCGEPSIAVYLIRKPNREPPTAGLRPALTLNNPPVIAAKYVNTSLPKICEMVLITSSC